MSGPLTGVKILEIAGIGAVPFAGMVLADAGADVLRIDRRTNSEEVGSNSVTERMAQNFIHRGRRSIVLDLKHPPSVNLVLKRVERAEGLLEGFRPGVAERLGIGPEACLERNPLLVYGRVTGWGRSGPYANAAGHDINYIALSGSLLPIGPAASPPVPPLNLLGDYGGGGMLLAYGMTCALFETSRSGKGQVVDASMLSGATYLATFIHGMRSLGQWNDQRETNILDGAAPFYKIYETSDRQYLAFGAIEEHFFAELLDLVGLSGVQVPSRHDRTEWSALHERLTGVFASRTRQVWEEVFAGTDACVSPVLSISEAPMHEHNRESGVFVEFQGEYQPAPEPRFSRTSSNIRRSAPRLGQGGNEALSEWGFEDTEIQELIEIGVIQSE